MVSVILPTFNAGEGISSFLSMIGNQTVECELVVIDSSSTDGTQEIVRSYGAKVISIAKTDFNHGRARNMAIRSSRGDIVVLFTQDALPCDERCIERLIEPLTLEDVAASYGRQLPKAGAKPTERFARLFNYPDSPEVKGPEDVPRMGIKAFFFSNVFSAIRRREFEGLGMFPENVIMFEDMIYAAKLITNGYRIAYVPGAMVVHSHDYSLAEQFKRYRCAGASFRKHPWFMEYARSGKEGRSYFMRQMRYLMREKEHRWMAYALCEAVCKYCGYHLGLHYDTVSAASPPQGGK